MPSADLRRLVQDPRRDAAAIVLLFGLIVFCGAPFLLGRMCDSPLVLPGLAVGPALLAASILIRSSRGWAFAGAGLIFVLLFVVEVLVGFVVSVDHCGLQLG